MHRERALLQTMSRIKGVGCRCNVNCSFLCVLHSLINTGVNFWFLGMIEHILIIANEAGYLLII